MTSTSQSLDSSRMISLNLSDLKSISNNGNQQHNLPSNLPVPINHAAEYLQSQFQELNKYEMNYQNSLEILLNKAQGTAYEAIIRKLYQEKENFGQLDYDLEDYTTNRKGPSSNYSSPKIDLQKTDRSSTPISASEQQKVTETLAKPLARNMWKVHLNLIRYHLA